MKLKSLIHMNNKKVKLLYKEYLRITTALKE